MKSTDQATRCPACKTVFRVVADQLRVSEGWVRCGRCAEVFNATEHMMEMDRSWSRASEDAADRRPGEAADARPERAPSPDVWRVPRAMSHRAKQDQDVPDTGRLATKIEAAMSRAQTAPGGAAQAGPTSANALPPLAPLYPHAAGRTAPPDEDWSSSAVAPLAFEPSGDAYLTDLPDDLRPDFRESLQARYQEDLAPRSHAAPPAAAPYSAPTPPPPPPAPAPPPPTIPSAALPFNAPAVKTPVPNWPARTEPSLAPPATRPGHPDDYPTTEPALFGAEQPAMPWEQGPARDSYDSGEEALDAADDEFRAEPRIDPRLRSPTPSSAKPGFMRKAERDQLWRRPRMRALLLGGLAGSALLLATQVTIAYRDLVAARFPATKPVLQSMCAGLGCSVQAARSIDSLAVESSGLVRVDKTPLYKLQVTLRNRANLELALPALDVTFTDSKGELIARKVLLPQDLSSTMGTSAESLGAGREVTLQGTLQSSGAAPETVAGYTVELFYP